MTDIVVDIDNELNDELETLGGNDVPVKQEQQNETPAKFRDADKDTVVKSYLELEKTLGRQAQEIGELRRFTDQYLRQELEKVAPPKKEKPQVEFEDFVNNPGDAVSRVVEPKLQEVDEKIAQYERMMRIENLRKKHGDFEDTTSSPEFIEFVKKSPYRMRQYVQANNHYDVDAADELLTMYNEHRDFVKTQVETKQAERRNADLRAVTTESTSNGTTQRKVYRRSDLINLRVNNPDKYAAMSDEIMAAYAEGRVK